MKKYTFCRLFAEAPATFAEKKVRNYEKVNFNSSIVPRLFCGRGTKS
ncbi:MAG: hypothetical protein J1E33_06020 [Alistipes sp.]|nr:hypothetical protein [Alistipes sp.]